MSASGLLRRRTPVALAAVLAAVLAASISAAPSSEASPRQAKLGTPTSPRSSSCASTTSTAQSSRRWIRRSHRIAHGGSDRPADDPVPTACLAPTCFAAGGAEYLSTHVRELCGQETPEHVVRLGRRPDRRDALHLGAVPRRADGRGPEPDGPRLQRRRQPRVRRGRRPSCCACRTAAATRSTAASRDGDGFATRCEVQYLAANVRTRTPARRSSRPTRSRSSTAAKIGFIGMTLEGTADIVSPSGVDGLDFRDEVDAGNALVPQLQGTGCRGHRRAAARGWQVADADSADHQRAATACRARRSSTSRRVDEIDVVVTGHTHLAVQLHHLDGKVVTGAAVLRPDYHRDEPQ